MMTTATQNKTTRPYTDADVGLIERLRRAEARDDFWSFRQQIRPDMHVGWFVELLANEFQIFYERWMRGERPVMVLTAPPQHGKSWTLIDFIAWMMGKVEVQPRMIYASYSDELGKTYVNANIQRVIDNENYRKIYEHFALKARNSHMLAVDNSNTLFRNVTVVRGQITGLGLDLGFIDDPIKGRADASSKLVRDNAWNWLTSDFISRFSDKAGFIMTMTRWHIDDPIGRFLLKFPEARVLNFPAIAEVDEPHRKAGEALFPEFKPLEFLLKTKAMQTAAEWESLYQQNPIIKGGELFPIEKFTTVQGSPDRKEVKRTVRYWDKAGTEGGGAWTAGVRMHLMRDNRFIVSDVVRGQWAALKREEIIKNTCKTDQAEYGGSVETWIEQEPGSGGKESAERTIANLRGFIIKADRVTGKKEVRAEPYAAQVQGGNVFLVAAAWNRPYIDEHEVFPNGKSKDQVDAAAGACMKLALSKGSYDRTLSWVR